ncbi:MAG: glycerol-3-phosphate acyltransferase [Opitutaceae bacterium]
MSPAAWLVIPAAYLLGGVSPGYFLVRRRTGQDVRAQGSGATGATNAARILGGRGFVLVLFLDAVKGAIAAFGARLAGLESGWEFAAATAVVAGHVWPIQLGFRGGRGLGPLLGAWLVLAPLAIGGCLVIAGVTWAITKRRIGAGLFGALFLSATTWWETHSAVAAVCAGVTFCIVAIAHSTHLHPNAAPPTQHKHPTRLSVSSHESPESRP